AHLIYDFCLSVDLLACSRCTQRFVKIFAQRSSQFYPDVSSPGDDAWYSSLMPITEAEAADLEQSSAATPSARRWRSGESLLESKNGKLLAGLAELGSERRSLRVDFAGGAAPVRVFWWTGTYIGPHGPGGNGGGNGGAAPRGAGADLIDRP